MEDVPAIVDSTERQRGRTDVIAVNHKLRLLA